MFLCVLPIWREDYNISLTRRKNAEKNLAATALKFYDILASENRILDTYSKYQKIFSISQRQSCTDKIELIKKFEDLGIKYNLFDPIKTTLYQSFFKTSSSLNNNSVKIKNYDIKLKFNVPNYASFLKVIKDIYELSPTNTIILYIEVEEQNILDDTIINKLTNSHLPDLIYSQINFRIRELSTINNFEE